MGTTEWPSDRLPTCIKCVGSMPHPACTGHLAGWQYTGFEVPCGCPCRRSAHPAVSGDPALVARTVALDVGLDAYGAAFHRFAAGRGLFALEAVATAQTGLDVLTRQAIDHARAQGATWEQIATALGIDSGRAAQARYGVRPALASDGSGPQPRD